MPLIQTPDIGLKLFRRYRLEVQPDSVLAPEIVPVVLVDDISAAQIGRKAYGFGDQAAVVGQLGECVLVNNSRGNTHVTAVTITSSGSPVIFDLVRPTVGISGLASSGSTSWAEGDTPGRPTNPVGIRTVAAHPAHRVLNRIRLDNASVRLPLDYYLGVGVGAGQRTIAVFCQTANQIVRVSWEWTELQPQG